jgi:hypothetical protein
MAMNKYFILLAAEVLAGAVGFFLVIVVIVVASLDVEEFLFDLKTRLIGVAFVIPFFKIISGYYLLVWGYLRQSHQEMSNLSGCQYLTIFAIALMSVLILIALDSMRYSSEFMIRFISLLEEFFLIGSPMAKFVYAGIISCLVAPKLVMLMKLRKYQR